jgi:hypothetical protein
MNSPALNSQAPPQPRTLGYAKPPRWSRRKWLRRAALLVLAGAVVFLFTRRHEVADWVSRVRLRRAALAHSVNPDAAVMTQLPTDTAGTWGKNPSQYAAPDPMWLEVQRRLVPAPQTAGSSVNVFLHERVSPAGNRRVVAVNLATASYPDGPVVLIDIRLFDPGSPLNPRFRELKVADVKGVSTIPRFPGGIFSLAFVPWGSDFRLYPGRPDPADRSRFFIPYDHNGTSGEFVGQLGDDDSVRFHDANGDPLPKQFPRRPLLGVRGQRAGSMSCRARASTTRSMVNWLRYRPGHAGRGWTGRLAGAGRLRIPSHRRAPCGEGGSSSGLFPAR